MLWNAIDRVGGESNLVVDDDVDGAAGGITVELRQIQRFGHHALPGEGGVAMDQNRDDARALGVAQTVLLRTNDAFNHRIDSFEMAGIEGHRDDDFFALSEGACRSRRGDILRRRNLPRCSDRRLQTR